MEFKEWFEKLKKVASEHPIPEVREFYVGCVNDDNADCWTDYFEGDYTPEEALAEDLTYA